MTRLLLLAALLLPAPLVAQTRPQQLGDLPADLPRAIRAAPLNGTNLDPLSAPAYIRAAQEALRDQGLYRGPISEQADTRGFAQALRTWQKAMGMEPSGILDEPSAVALAQGLRPVQSLLPPPPSRPASPKTPATAPAPRPQPLTQISVQDDATPVR